MSRCSWLIDSVGLSVSKSSKYEQLVLNSHPPSFDCIIEYPKSRESRHFHYLSKSPKLDHPALKKSHPFRFENNNLSVILHKHVYLMWGVDGEKRLASEKYLE